MNKNKLKFSTKAKTLVALGNVLKLSTIPALHYFTIHEWFSNRKNVLRKIKDDFKNSELIVRSSSLSEDNELLSQAGQFSSVLNIKANDEERLCEAIAKVIDSYYEGKEPRNNSDQVLVQCMVQGVSMSGVLFTQDLNTGAPYYVINYDDQTGKTDSVTSGNEYSNRTLFVSRMSVKEVKSIRFKKLLRAVEEIEKVTENKNLDIEYAVDNENNIYILQVRPISTIANWNRGITLQINDAIKCIQDFIVKDARPKPNIFGKRSIYGQMPDWNPAELIGSSPRPLAFSLYRKLISDRTWRMARKELGYAEPTGTNLISSIGGKPFVDVRLSFHSFLPADIEINIGHKLVDAWIERLSRNHELHDKIEFEIALTAYFPDFDKTMSSWYSGLLNKKEYESYRCSLFSLTNRIISQQLCSIKKEIQKIENLERLQQELYKNHSLNEIDTAASLLEVCIDYGTLPFSILARFAFVGVGFLKSLVRLEILNQDEVSAFQASIQTVAGKIIKDLHSISAGGKDLKEFLEKYGHLRPGTYDILSLRYDQRQHFFTRDEKLQAHDNATFELSENKNRKITEVLEKCGFGISGFELLDFVKESIIAREYAKFAFTCTISNVLEIISCWGEENGLSREELSYIDIETLLDTRTVTKGRSLESHLRQKYQEGKNEHDVTLALHLPYIIDTPDDVTVIPLLLSRPNFITNKTIRGKILEIDGHFDDAHLLDDKILLIEGADPGYDWIFSRPILGLITKFGGVNSHMAIRCAEFGLPAVIGCGEQIFDRLMRTRYVELNCAEHHIVPVGN